ncbi:hypothetical protein ElyMa_002108800 [Elysia marginata]|uniref:Uncharacterized protein n=1 Tax=Elysia marginata TaxID=1093978 RepID=A0AAV4FH84_9GAST|nr:hypothetical protein ElyMa_002108800 [Elysia marginata]
MRQHLPNARIRTSPDTQINLLQWLKVYPMCHYGRRLGDHKIVSMTCQRPSTLATSCNEALDTRGGSAHRWWRSYSATVAEATVRIVLITTRLM